MNNIDRLFLIINMIGDDNITANFIWYNLFILKVVILFYAYLQVYLRRNSLKNPSRFALR